MPYSNYPFSVYLQGIINKSLPSLAPHSKISYFWITASTLKQAHLVPILSFPTNEDNRRLETGEEESQDRPGKRFLIMEIKVESGTSDIHHQNEEQKVPLLQDDSLPTGTVLAFQLLSPIFSNGGKCDAVSHYMTASLVAICGLACFLLSFTDSYRDKKGNICYGFATITGFWVVDGSATLPAELSKSYRLCFMDFIHAIMSALVFGAVALFDENVVNCFYPEPSAEEVEVLTALPVGIGVFCSMLFATFPTKRHGIGFPLPPK